MYKDRLHAALRREWDGQDQQSPGHPNFPSNYPDAFFKQLTVESKREKINERTGQRIGWEWYRPSGVDNEAWDLSIYNMAALDLVAYGVCIEQFELDYVNWEEFWNYCQEYKPFQFDSGIS
jgi:phage terminase large subunit GpA-like protein